METKIKEIFSSIQGEGLYAGQKHTFVRFCKCNLACEFCDTDFDFKNAENYSIDELYNHLSKENSDMISLTGGEPLLDIEFLIEFLKKYKNKLNQKIYLETNGTLYEKLNSIIDYIDIISMDIKIESATRQKNNFSDNEKFLDIASKKETFIKIVFDEKISDDEIKSCINLAKKYSNTIILQPKMPINKELNEKKLNEIFEKFYNNHKNTRLIPQTHKFLNLA